MGIPSQRHTQICCRSTWWLGWWGRWLWLIWSRTQWCWLAQWSWSNQIHNWSCSVLKYCLSVFLFHIFYCHWLWIAIKALFGLHGESFPCTLLLKIRIFNCPVIFQSKVLKNSLKGVLKGFTLPNVHRKINDSFLLNALIASFTTRTNNYSLLLLKGYIVS